MFIEDLTVNLKQPAVKVKKNPKLLLERNSNFAKISYVPEMLGDYLKS